MKFKFNNLAHIKYGEFEIGKLTVLIGDNGSGKTLLLETFSYLLELYYAEINRIVEEVIDNGKGKLNFNDVGTNLKTIVEQYLIDKKNNNRSEEIKMLSLDISFGDFGDINKVIYNELEKKKQDILKKVKERIFRNSSSEFDFEILNVPELEAGSREYKIGIDLIGMESLYLIEESLFISVNMKEFLFDEVKHVAEKNMVNLTELNADMVDFKKIIETHKAAIVKAIIMRNFNDYFLRGQIAYYPSERKESDLNNLHANFDNNSVENLLRYSEYSYSDFLESNRRFLRRYNFRTQFSQPLINLIGGNPIFDDDGNVKSIMIGEDELSSNLFSTRIAKTVPYIYLESPLSRIDTLILEEPEAHLSLKTMDLFISFLENQNKRRSIIVTTHSDVFYQKLMNLINSRHDYDHSVFVYEIISEEGRSILKKCEQFEYGFEVEFFQDALESHYQETLKAQDGDKS